MKNYLALLGLVLLSNHFFAQALPIVVDGQYADWDNVSNIYTDNTNDGNAVDFYDFSAANDDDFLYVRFRTNIEVDLMENNSMVLLIDADNDASTGSFTQNIGADIRINLGQRNVTVFHPAFLSTSLERFQFRVAPTVTSDQFEIAINRASVNIQGYTVNFSDTVKLVFRDYANNGDAMPDGSATFTYAFDDAAINEPTTIDLSNTGTNTIRLMTYNTEFDGLTDNGRRASFERIIIATNPDVIAFNETWNTDLVTIQNFMNNILPQSNGWYGYKNNGNATLSKYPILQNWNVYTNRVQASLIDVSNSNLGKDSLLVINGHLKCCDGDDERQRQADRFAQFILDAKTIGGTIDLTQGTPFVLMGDMNLVGESQQLKTLLTGQIINTGTYGQGGALDWDNTELKEPTPRQTDDRMTYTWRNDNSSYPPGQLDFLIYSNAVIHPQKAFVIRTEAMSATRLTNYNLQSNDTETASDHYPVVVDFAKGLGTNTKNITWQPTINIFPNPTADYLYINIEIKTPLTLSARLIDLSGKTIKVFDNQTLDKGNQQLQYEVHELPNGIYNLILSSEKGIVGRQVVKMK